MPFKLSRTIKNLPTTGGVDPTVREYEDRFRAAGDDVTKNDGENYRAVNNLYYNLVTDFYEYGWGRSFHFAPRIHGESFKASLARHERNIAQALELKPGMVVADVGCGVAGPLMEIARYSGAKIIGLNDNAYQIERAWRYVEKAGVAHLADFLQGDFLHVDAPDASFDAAYSIEATCIAPDKVSIYGEIFRLLKPGGRFAAYEYIMTDRFDPQNPRHLKLKEDIQLGGGLLRIDDRQDRSTTRCAPWGLRCWRRGTLRCRRARRSRGTSRWLAPASPSPAFRSTRIGRFATQSVLRVLETVRLAPKGTVRVSETLNLCADGMVEAGRLGIFTPMYFIHARKPG